MRSEVHGPNACKKRNGASMNRDSQTWMTNDEIRRNTEFEGRTGHGTPEQPSAFGLRISFVICPSSFVIRQQVPQRFRADKDTETIFVRPESLGKSARFNVPMHPRKRKRALHEPAPCSGSYETPLQQVHGPHQMMSLLSGALIQSLGPSLPA